MVPFSSSICEDLAWFRVVRTEKEEREKVCESKKGRGEDGYVRMEEND